MDRGVSEHKGEKSVGSRSLITLGIENGNYRVKLITGGSPEQSWLYPSEESILDFFVSSLHMADEEARDFAREACANAMAQRSVELSDDDIRAISAPTE